MSDTDALRALLARVEACGPKGDRELDCLLWCQFAESHFEYHGGDCVLAVMGGFSARLDWEEMPHPTSSLDAAVALVERVLPGWAWSCGTCVVSNDGWVKPDVDGPDKHLCDVFDDGFFGDAKGGSVPLSLLVAMLHGLIAKATVEAGLPFKSHLETRREAMEGRCDR